MIQQGHKYDWHGQEVLAMESAPNIRGQLVKVCQIDRRQMYPLNASISVMVDRLKPLPMVYFHGQTPK